MAQQATHFEESIYPSPHVGFEDQPEIIDLEDIPDAAAEDNQYRNMMRSRNNSGRANGRPSSAFVKTDYHTCSGSEFFNHGRSHKLMRSKGRNFSGRVAIKKSQHHPRHLKGTFGGIYPTDQQSEVEGVNFSKLTRSNARMRASSAYSKYKGKNGVYRGDYYGGMPTPAIGRRDNLGFFSGRFKTAEQARKEAAGWKSGYQMIANSIAKVASGQAYDEGEFVHEDDCPEMGQTFNNTRVRFEDYHAPRRPQSSLGPRYRGNLSRAQRTPFPEPGAGSVADNHTYDDFGS